MGSGQVLLVVGSADDPQIPPGGGFNPETRYARGEIQVRPHSGNGRLAHPGMEDRQIDRGCGLASPNEQVAALGCRVGGYGAADDAVISPLSRQEQGKGAVRELPFKL